MAARHLAGTGALPEDADLTDTAALLVGELSAYLDEALAAADAAADRVIVPGSHEAHEA